MTIFDLVIAATAAVSISVSAISVANDALEKITPDDPASIAVQANNEHQVTQ